MLVLPAKQHLKYQLSYLPELTEHCAIARLDQVNCAAVIRFAADPALEARTKNTLRLSLVCAALVAATVAVYSQVVDFEYTEWDDPKYVTRNPNVNVGLTSEGIKWAFSESHASNWHPLSWISHMLDCELFGLDPAGPHAVNLAFHLLNTLLLFVVLMQMTGRMWPSGFVAALFALHPLHVESVAWVTERKDVLSTFFGLLSMSAYVAYVRRNGLGRYLLTALLLAAGLMAKPMLVTWPLVFLLLDYWPLDRVRLGPAVQQRKRDARARPSTRESKQGKRSIKAEKKRRALQRKESPPTHEPRHAEPVKVPPVPRRPLEFLLWEKLPLLLLSVISSVITYLAQQRGPAMAAGGFAPFDARLANAAVAYVWYIAKTIWPSGLATIYTHPNLPGGTLWPAWQIGGAVLLLVALSVIVIRLARFRYVAFGWLFYLGTLVPVIGLVQVGNQAFADRYTYIPLIGLFVIVAWSCAEIVSGLESRRTMAVRVLAVAVVAVLTASAAAARAQTQYWRNSVLLFERAVKISPEDPTMRFNLGNMRKKEGDIDEAIHHYLEAVRLRPNYYKAHLNLGLVFDSNGQSDLAIGHFRKAVKVWPGYAKAHYQLGRMLEKTQQYEPALKHYRKAVRLEPSLQAARNGEDRLSERLER